MAMVLKGMNGNEFELGFTREQRPEMQDGSGDSSWATVNVLAATADVSWEEDSPAMNLYEFEALAQWLEAVAGAPPRQMPEVSELELLQPELKFTVSQAVADAVTIRVSFHLADRPEEFDVDDPTDDAQYVDVHLSRASVRAAAKALRHDLREVFHGTPKDSIRGDGDSGVMGVPDDNLNLIDRISRRPPGAGRGEDNAGNRS